MNTDLEKREECPAQQSANLPAFDLSDACLWDVIEAALGEHEKEVLKHAVRFAHASLDRVEKLYGTEVADTIEGMVNAMNCQSDEDRARLEAWFMEMAR